MNNDDHKSEGRTERLSTMFAQTTGEAALSNAHHFFGGECPYCGDVLTYESNEIACECKCKSCGFTKVGQDAEDLDALYHCGEYVKRITTILYADATSKKEVTIAFEQNTEELNVIREKSKDKWLDDIYFEMVHVAYLTQGFTSYKGDYNRNRVESLCNTAEKYLKEHPKARKIERLIDFYHTNLQEKYRKKRRFCLIAIPSAIAAVIIAFFVGLLLYAPTPFDASSGIEIYVPGGAVSMFDKFSLNIAVEKQSTDSPSYVDAKNALRKETETFELWDLSLTSSGEALQPKDTVRVTIPIPDGYQSNCLKVYRIVSDEEYREVSSTVSVAQKTITFYTDHFSLFAVAERHPIVQFDTGGGGEVEQQIVKRDNFAVCPSEPSRNGYLFGGWYWGDRLWGFDTDTVKKDITLTARWNVIHYAVSLQTNGSDPLPEGSYTVETGMELPIPIRKGYAFLGWYDNAALEGASIEQIPTGATGNRAFYAKWSEPIVYNVTFISNGGEDVAPITFNVLDWSSMSDIVLPELEWEDHIFFGWYTDSAFSGERVYRIEQGTCASFTFYAKWRLEEYRIDYNLGGGKFDINASAPTSYKTGTATLDISVPIYTANMTNTAYAKYNLFMGWYEDAAYTVAFDPKNNDLTTDPRNLYLYAKWDIVKVYTGWELFPNAFAVNGNDTTRLNQRFLIDLSVCIGTGIYSDKAITLTNCKEIILIGNPDVVYRNLILTAKGYTDPEGLAITLENFNMTGNILCDSSAIDLTLNCIGTSRIEGVSVGNATISGFADMTIIGDGALSIYGLDGIDGQSAGGNGANGECAIKADTLTVNMIGTLNVYGGDGGDGVDGTDGIAGTNGHNVGWFIATGNSRPGGDGTDGKNGGNGGQGGASTITNNVNIILGSVVFQGGNGGSGGKGGDGGRGGKGGTNNWNTWATGGRAGSGGDGGNGGNSGMAGNQALMSADYIAVAKDATLTIYRGNYGIAGTAGEGGLKGPPSGDPQGDASGGQAGVSGVPGIVLGNPTTTPESRFF